MHTSAWECGAPAEKKGQPIGQNWWKSRKKKKNCTFQEKLLSVEFMFTAFNIPLVSSIYKKWYVLCFGQAHCTYWYYEFCSHSFLFLRATLPQFSTAGFGCHILQDFMDSESYMLIIKYLSAVLLGHVGIIKILILAPQQASVMLPKTHLNYCKCALCSFWTCNTNISGIAELQYICLIYWTSINPAQM